MTRIAARAPNHLGDGVMALPALHALARLGRLTIHAPPWGPDLYRGVDAEVRPRAAMTGDVAVLFPPSLRAAWEARRIPRRVGTATDHRRWLLTDVVAEGVHRADTYAALATAVGARVEDPPRYPLRTDDPGVDVPEGHVALVPLAASGAVVQWAGYHALAERLGPVVWYAGPGESLDAFPGERRVGLPLPAFAAALSRARVVVANDSGAAHFARAVGVPTVVVFGSTSPEKTGPSGAVAVQGPDLACRPCYRKRCPYGLPCLDVSVDAVIAAIEAAIG